VFTTTLCWTIVFNWLVANVDPPEDNSFIFVAVAHDLVLFTILFLLVVDCDGYENEYWKNKKIIFMVWNVAGFISCIAEIINFKILFLENGLIWNSVYAYLMYIQGTSWAILLVGMLGFLLYNLCRLGCEPQQEQARILY
jgi:hypothetical protein